MITEDFTYELRAVKQLSFVADTDTLDNGTLSLIILAPQLSRLLPVSRAVLSIPRSSFSLEHVIETYNRVVVDYLRNTLDVASNLLAEARVSVSNVQLTDGGVH